VQRNNSNSFVYFLIVALVIFLIFQFLGVLFLVLKGLAIIIFRFWYLFLAAGLILYFTRNKKSRKEKVYKVKNPGDKKTIEINDDDYEVQ